MSKNLPSAHVGHITERPSIRFGHDEIAIRKLAALALPRAPAAPRSLQAPLQVEAMRLGFAFEEDALKALAASPERRHGVFAVLQQLVGADQTWEPFYPNFPRQVLDAPDEELFFNAVRHYWSFGAWRPEYEEHPRLPSFERTTFKRVGWVSHETYMEIFTCLLEANGALPELDRSILRFFVQAFDDATLLSLVPSNIPFKETMCQLVADALEFGRDGLSRIGVQTTTDVLRVATRLSGGDVSLTTNTRFRLTRAQRRWLVSVLEPVIREEDLARHRGKWKRLFHCLHIGEFTQASRTRALAQKLRDGRLVSANTLVEQSLLQRDHRTLVTLLQRKPGEFARRIDHLLRLFPEDISREILGDLLPLLPRVDTRVLVQMLGHFSTRRGLTKRVVLPKGAISRAVVLDKPPQPIPEEHLQTLISAIKSTLSDRFASRAPLGRVWIDPRLRDAPVPLQLRTAPEGLSVVQRGTHLPMGAGNTLRFFVHWVGEDIDLSACFLTEDLRFHSEIAYYKLREQGQDAPYRAVHSGDVVWAPAPDGGAEFIDIYLDSIKDPAIRYAAMDVRVFDGPSLRNQSANAGWMMRDGEGEAGAIFDARTVEQRIALSVNAYTALIAVFDLRERKVIWLDLVGRSSRLRGGNNVANHRFDIRDMVDAAINSRLLSMHDLLSMHARARGTLVQDRSDADHVWDLSMAYRFDEVLAKYMA